jgi:coenzyme F420 hydrogenase subunit beta
MNNNTIAQVVRDGLCTGCGTCIALCPEEAIKLTINEKKGIYVPTLNEEKCNSCSICYEVCPGHEVDFKALNLEILGKEPENVLIGNYLNCYVSHSTDYDIRYNSSSGGIVTKLLIFALEEGIIE